MIHTALSSAPLDVDALSKQAQSSAAGGVVIFIGTTRDNNATVTALEYEAYESRATEQMHDIAAQAKNKWNLEAALIVHRTGIVNAGDPGVVVIATAAHRDVAFEACEWMIDAVKTDAAIWKRELYSDGSSRWLGLPAPQQQSPK